MEAVTLDRRVPVQQRSALGRMGDAQKVHRHAVMIYGSQARGTADATSDIDVLQVTASSPRNYSWGTVHITAYTPEQLHRMARAGSLFILHLLTEGRILSDSDGILTRVLASYRQPSDYARHQRELTVAASALDASAADLARHADALGHLGLYLIRTSAYIRCIQAGTITFNFQTVSEVLAMPILSAAFRLRHAKRFTPADLALMTQCLVELLPGVTCNRFNSIEALATAAASDFPYASSLLTSILKGEDVDYGAISLPPL